MSNNRIALMVNAVKPMYEITSMSALLAEYVLNNYDRVFEYARETNEGKEYLSDYFIKKGFKVFKGFANFLHVDFGERKKSIVAFLAKNNVLFKDSFEHPSLVRFSRFTVGPKESLDPFIDKFNELL